MIFNEGDLIVKMNIKRNSIEETYYIAAKRYDNIIGQHYFKLRNLHNPIKESLLESEYSLESLIENNKRYYEYVHVKVLQ